MDLSFFFLARTSISLGDYGHRISLWRIAKSGEQSVEQESMQDGSETKVESRRKSTWYHLNIVVLRYVEKFSNISKP